jgi:hypothetical protein
MCAPRRNPAATASLRLRRRCPGSYGKRVDERYAYHHPLAGADTDRGYGDIEEGGHSRSGAIFLGALAVGGFYAVKWLFIGGMMAVALISSQIEKAEAERAARAAAADRLEAIKAEEARARRLDEIIKAHPIPLRPTTPSR